MFCREKANNQGWGPRTLGEHRRAPRHLGDMYDVRHTNQEWRKGVPFRPLVATHCGCANHHHRTPLRYSVAFTFEGRASCCNAHMGCPPKSCIPDKEKYVMRCRVCPVAIWDARAAWCRPRSKGLSQLDIPATSATLFLLDLGSARRTVFGEICMPSRLRLGKRPTACAPCARFHEDDAIASAKISMGLIVVGVAERPPQDARRTSRHDRVSNALCPDSLGYRGASWPPNGCDPWLALKGFGKGPHLDPQVKDRKAPRREQGALEATPEGQHELCKEAGACCYQIAANDNHRPIAGALGTKPTPLQTYTPRLGRSPAHPRASVLVAKHRLQELLGPKYRTYVAHSTPAERPSEIVLLRPDAPHETWKAATDDRCRTAEWAHTHTTTSGR